MPLARQDVVELEGDVEADGVQGLDLAHNDVVVVEPALVIEGDGGAGVRLLDHVLAIGGVEARPLRAEIGAHELRHIEGHGGGPGRTERHDRDRNGFGLSFVTWTTSSAWATSSSRTTEMAASGSMEQRRTERAFIHRV